MAVLRLAGALLVVFLFVVFFAGLRLAVVLRFAGLRLAVVLRFAGLRLAVVFLAAGLRAAFFTVRFLAGFLFAVRFFAGICNGGNKVGVRVTGNCTLFLFTQQNFLEAYKWNYAIVEKDQNNQHRVFLLYWR